MIDLAAVRRNMVDTQLRTYDVSSKRVLDAVDEVAREHFLPASLSALAYADQSLTVRAADGTERVLLLPMILARMIQAAEIEPGAKVLSVAGGTGYGAAVMAAMGAKVTLLESGEALAGEARRALAAPAPSRSRSSRVPWPTVIRPVLPMTSSLSRARWSSSRRPAGPVGRRWPPDRHHGPRSCRTGHAFPPFRRINGTAQRFSTPPPLLWPPSAPRQISDSETHLSYFCARAAEMTQTDRRLLVLRARIGDESRTEGCFGGAAKGKRCRR